METVSTMGCGSIGQEIDVPALVKEVATKKRSADADISNTGMANFHLEDEGAAYLIYRTGKFQIRGAGSVESLSEAAETFRDTLSGLGIDVSDFDFEHVTSVFMTQLDRQFNLEVIAVALGIGEVEYEPEQFPGLFYRPPDSKATLLVFSNGKVLINGLTEINEAEAAVRDFENRAAVLDKTALNGFGETRPRNR